MKRSIRTIFPTVAGILALLLIGGGFWAESLAKSAFVVETSCALSDCLRSGTRTFTGLGMGQALAEALALLLLLFLAAYAVLAVVVLVGRIGKVFRPALTIKDKMWGAGGAIVLAISAVGLVYLVYLVFFRLSPGALWQQWVGNFRGHGETLAVIAAVVCGLICLALLLVVLAVVWLLCFAVCEAVFTTEMEANGKAKGIFLGIYDLLSGLVWLALAVYVLIGIVILIATIICLMIALSAFDSGHYVVDEYGNRWYIYR